MSVGVGKPLRNYAAQSVNIIASTGQRFLLSKTGVSERARHARSAVERGVRLARRPRHRLISLARRPPATPTPHSAPPHQCIVNTTGRPSAPGTGGAATAAADQTGPRALCTAPTHNFTTARHLGSLQKINNFRFLKKTRKQRPASCEIMAAAQIPMRTMRRKQTQHLFSVLLIGLVVRRAEILYATRSVRYINGIIELVRACRARPAKPPPLPDHCTPMDSIIDTNNYTLLKTNYKTNLNSQKHSYKLIRCYSIYCL